jgi:hypothetical protein
MVWHVVVVGGKIDDLQPGFQSPLVLQQLQPLHCSDSGHHCPEPQPGVGLRAGDNVMLPHPAVSQCLCGRHALRRISHKQLADEVLGQLRDFVPVVSSHRFVHARLYEAKQLSTATGIERGAPANEDVGDHTDRPQITFLPIPLLFTMAHHHLWGHIQRSPTYAVQAIGIIASASEPEIGHFDIPPCRRLINISWQ